MSKKKCKKCLIIKDVNDFHRLGKGFRPRCKTCMNEQQKEYYELNKDKCNKKAMAYYELNKEAVLKQQREYQQKRKKLK